MLLKCLTVQFCRSWCNHHRFAACCTTTQDQCIQQHTSRGLALRRAHRCPSLLGSGSGELPLRLGPGAWCRYCLPGWHLSTSCRDSQSFVQAWSGGVPLVQDAQGTWSSAFLWLWPASKVQCWGGATWCRAEYQHSQGNYKERCLITGFERVMGFLKNVGNFFSMEVIPIREDRGILHYFACTIRECQEILITVHRECNFKAGSESLFLTVFVVLCCFCFV